MLLFLGPRIDWWSFVQIRFWITFRPKLKTMVRPCFGNHSVLFARCKLDLLMFAEMSLKFLLLLLLRLLLKIGARMNDNATEFFKLISGFKGMLLIFFGWFLN